MHQLRQGLTICGVVREIVVPIQERLRVVEELFHHIVALLSLGYEIGVALWIIEAHVDVPAWGSLHQIAVVPGDHQENIPWLCGD